MKGLERDLDLDRKPVETTTGTALTGEKVEVKIPAKFIGKPVSDLINHPSHYTFGKIEVIEVIEDWKLPYHLACVLKYIARAGKKVGSPAIVDLRKAKWYLDRLLDKLE